MQTYNLCMTTLEEIFARNIRKLRNDKNLTQEQAAEGIGISLTGYQNYEGGRRPKKEIFRKIAEFYEVSPDSLYKDSHNESRPKTFAETLSPGRLMELLNKKFSVIPLDVWDLAAKLDDPENEEWDSVRGALRHALLEQERLAAIDLEKSKKA
jgi:transcriptional regulator with XRE-family HTH domain